MLFLLSLYLPIRSSSRAKVGLRHTALEAIDTATAQILRLLACVDRVTHATNFHRLLCNRTWNHKDSAAGAAGCFGVFVHRWVDGGFHE